MARDVALALQDQSPSFERVTRLLGGGRTLGKRLESKLDVHEIILRGLPRAALSHVVSQAPVLRQDEVASAVGMSVRTVQRLGAEPRGRLSKEQSGRTWKFAELLAKATDVFGSRAEAERWLKTPAIALEQRSPLELLGSPAGVELVEQLLGRLEYGVYT